MGRPAKPRIQKQCKGCGAPFEVPHGRAQAQYCGVVCRNRAGADAVRRDWRCPCGNELPPRNETHAIYCSPECRATYGKKKGRKHDESAWVTFTCETCGETVTRYKKYGSGASRFCSNVCAHRRPIERHPTPDNVSLDSWWEHLVYAALKVAKIPVERVDRSVHGVEFDGRFYAPDFFLPEQNIYIEVKGVVTPEQEAKWIAFIDAGHDLLVIGPEQIEHVSPRSMGLVIQGETARDTREYQAMEQLVKDVDQVSMSPGDKLDVKMKAFFEMNGIEKIFEALRPLTNPT